MPYHLQSKEDFGFIEANSLTNHIARIKYPTSNEAKN